MNYEVFITAAVTGSGDTVGKSDKVPVTPKEIAEAAIESAKAGAAIAHCHVRDPETGAPARKVEYYREVVERIRESDTDVVINLTAGMGGDLTLGPVEQPLPPLAEGTDMAGATERMEHVATLLPEISSVKALTAAFTFANQTKGAAERGDGKRGAKTAARRLMARASDDALQEAITSHRRVDVRGSRGSGKSVALARLVMRARADGWVVAYVPDGLELTRLSYFSKSTKEGCDGLWETPDCAMRLLQHIANAANESVLKSVKVKGVTLKDENAPKKSRGKKSKDAADAPEADAKPKASAEMNLFDYAKAGSTDPEIAVDCALVVLNELRALAKNGDGKVMFVVDQYNALFGPSDMHEVTGPRSRKNIPAKSLRLARAVIETVDSACDEDARHVAVTAASHSVGVSKSNTEQSLPDELGSSTVVTVETPRFNTDEIATILREYKAAGIVKAVVDEQTVAAMKALTNGNPREIQSIASTLLR